MSAVYSLQSRKFLEWQLISLFIVFTWPWISSLFCWCVSVFVWAPAPFCFAMQSSGWRDANLAGGFACRLGSGFPVFDLFLDLSF